MVDPQWSSPEQAQEYGAALLVGERVTLRPATESDLGTLAQWWASATWAPLQQGVVRPRPIPPLVEMFRGWSQNSGAELGAGFSVVLTDADELVGHVVLHGRHQPARIATLAIIIGPPYVGRGLGTEATELMVRYGFDELGLNKVELQVWSYNQRAIRAYTKAGFVIEGERRAATFHAGQFHGETLMGMLVDEYRNHPGRVS